MINKKLLYILLIPIFGTSFHILYILVKHKEINDFKQSILFIYMIFAGVLVFLGFIMVAIILGFLGHILNFEITATIGTPIGLFVGGLLSGIAILLYYKKYDLIKK